MVRMTLCSCSTLLCLRLCSSAVGAKSGSLVRNTAVPGTMCGGFFSRLVQQRVERHLAAARLLREDARCRAARSGSAARSATPNSSGTQAPSNSFSRLAEKNVASTTTSGAISSAARQSGQRHSFQITMKPSSAVDHHGGGDGDAVGGGERARGAEQPRPAAARRPAGARVHARDVDLPGMRRRGVQDREPRQQAELDRLVRQRIGAGDHGLARDHGRGGRQHDHRQQQHARARAGRTDSRSPPDWRAPARPARNS